MKHYAKAIAAINLVRSRRMQQHTALAPAWIRLHDVRVESFLYPIRSVDVSA